MMAPKLLGRYIVSDPHVCHGKPTFRGTRIMVSQVLELVAAGVPKDRIVLGFRAPSLRAPAGFAVA